ncbi:ABC transporter permease [Amycolatopsis aidingensis]|uniref:ABC transporter permease n=1 Tax=Amycolatopsis aidingensis TaxID=2842453 RepID=UPI001C0CE413|nr:ABC transporter permease [Amycolatopsis aidingensis]
MTVPSPTKASRAGFVRRMIGNEIQKGLLITWRHRATVIPQLAFVTGLYWTIQFFVGGGTIVPQLAAQTLIGYLAFVVAYIALVRMAGGLLEEVFSGTFMQSLLSPLRPWVLTIGRLLGVLAEGVLSALVVAVLFVPLFSLKITFQLDVVFPAVLVLVEAAGFALFIGGLALVVNAIGAITHVLWTMLVMINGSFIPADVFPIWLEIVAKIWPTTLSVEIANHVLFEGAGLGELWADFSLQLAIGHAAVMLLLGWAVFQAAVHHGLKIGRLGP